MVASLRLHFYPHMYVLIHVGVWVLVCTLVWRLQIIFGTLIQGDSTYKTTGMELKA